MDPIVVIGNITCDVIVKVDHLPKVEDDLIIEKQDMQLGGCAFNVANMLHLHHYPYTLLSVVGNGMYGDFIRSQLKQRNFPSLQQAHGEQGCCYCFVDKHGERTFMAYHGVEYTFKKQWLQPYINNKIAYVYVCGLDIDENCGEEIISGIKALHAPVFFAPGPSCLKISKEKMEMMRSLKPILHVNEIEAMQLANTHSVEDALVTLHTLWQSKVIITLGKQGSCAIDDTGTYYVGTSPCEVVDTIGAGDTHAACVMLKLVQNYSLREALTYANAMSREVVQKQGATLSEQEFDKIV